MLCFVKSVFENLGRFKITYIESTKARDDAINVVVVGKDGTIFTDSAD